MAVRPFSSGSPVEPTAAGPAALSHQVVIIGGGLVGASLAIALHRSGVDVALVEATPAGTLPGVFDERNLSFAEATVNALTALGVMQKLRTAGGAIRRIHVSRQGDFGRVVLDAQRYGRSQFGQVVVARDFGDALEARLAELPGITRYRPARFAGLVDLGSDQRGLRVVDADGERVIGAQLLVGADGTHSGVRSALGLTAETHDYLQTLFVTRVRSERAPDGTAYERLTDHGPTALLPRADRHFGLIHSVPRDETDAVAALDDSAFLQRVQSAFGWRLGRLLSCGARSAYPATRVVAPRTVAARAVLIGNAAQTIHPVGAQGFNLGLRDALTLAELIGAERIAATTGARAADVGSDDLLARYTQRRAEDRARSLAFSDQLVRVSSNPHSILRPLRSLGLFAADRLPSVQSWLVGGAMGYRGDVPALCRAEGGQ